VLRYLRIANFKAWSDTGAVRLAPLTVLFGVNSSGKSSIHHLLMMLRQTIRSPDRRSVLDLGDAEAPVRLGGFRDVIFAHDTDRELAFETAWTLPAALAVRDPRSRQRYSGSHLLFRAKVRQAPGGRTLQSEGFEYALRDDERLVLAARFARDERRPDRWRIHTRNYDLVRTQGRAWELPKPIQFYGFPNEASVYFQNSAFLADLELALEDRFESLSYLGPLRQPPARLYSWAGTVPEDVGWRGENAVQAILAGEDRRFNWKPRSPTKPLVRVVGDWLSRMGLIEAFDVAEIGPERSEYEVRVRARRRSAEVKLTDVGFGVSQVLPVVAQAFYAPAESTVLMEQPEMHLHPRAQSELGDLLIAAITAREDGRPRNVQVIVESHSEHVLRRIQRRVAEEVISPEDVALYFCYPGPSGSVIDELEVNRFGDIVNWPPDFFGDELGDVAVQADIGMQRKLALRARSDRN
jgi:predicted ATPase